MGFGPRRGGGPPGMAPVIKPRNFRKTMLRLWSYFGRERLMLSLVLLLVLADAAVGLSAPYLIGRAVKVMSQGPGSVNFSLLGSIVLVLLASYIADGFVVMLQGWLMAGVSQRIVYHLRRTLFEKLHRLPVAFFDTRSHGDLMSRLTNDIDNVSTTISQSTTQLLSDSISVLGSLIMMTVLSPLLTLASMITVPLVLLLTRTITKKTSVLFKQQQAELGKLNGQIEESISGIHVVKAFNHEEKVIEQFENVNDSLCRVGIRAQIFAGFMMPLMNVIGNIGFAAVAGVGGLLAVGGMIDIGVIASFLSYSRQFTRPLNNIANTYNTLQTAVAGAERVFEIMDESEELPDKPGAIVLTDTDGNVTFEHVTFGYRPDVSILKDVSFKAEAGSNTALVGPTGAGKTTVVSLLSRFYDVTSGRILIDGRDIREYTRESLRKCFGIVLQDTYLFSGTIRDNIKYGKLDATDEEMKKAAQMANADDFIRRLPKGYDTELAESGSNLSQGQRQLLAIARAILAEPSILILDEATSNVDTRTELHIQEAMRQLMSGRTSFVIAHRLATIRDADQIMVIDNGTIVEKGSHEELTAKEGRYYELYTLQFKRGEEI
ncbi:MAG TPA: ABC transporter ATP-binding protein [Clostridia bacterium]|nr:ABC transporter ATP-binding protein [Clostridia bacterium]